MRVTLLRAPRPSAALVMLALLALALRLVVVALTDGANYDIMSYSIQAQSVLTHHNIYTFTDRYPYPPVWVWLTALAQWIANVTGLSFIGLVRLPGVVGDVCTVALLQRFKGNKAALFYAVNPASMLITAGHGQFDGLVLALVVAAWALAGIPQRRGIAWAALALGGAIALKGYPVLLLPALLIGAASWKRSAFLIGLALTPLLGCVLVYSAFFGLVPEMVTHILGYQSPPMLGWALFINKLLPQFVTPLGWPGRIATLLVPVLLALRKQTWPLEAHWLATFLGFYIFAPGVSPQYLLWALPLLAIVDLRKGFFYTFFSTLVLVFLYLWGFPEAVPWGPALASTTTSNTFLLGYWAANLAWWLGSLWLLGNIWRSSATSKPSLHQAIRYYAGKPADK